MTSVAVMGNIAVVTAPALADAEPGSVFTAPEVRRLLADQDRLGAAQLAIRGHVSAASGRKGGVVFAMAEPPPEFLDRLKVGDSYSQPLLAAARVEGDGTFGLKIPEGDAEEVYLRFVSADGADVGIAIAPIGAGPHTRSTAPATVDIDRTEPVDQVRDGTGTGGHLGCTTTVLNRGRARATVGIAGTESDQVSYNFTLTSSQNTKLGFGVKIGAGGRGAGSGSHTVKTGSSFSDNWGWRNAIGTYDFQAEVNTVHQSKRCSGQICQGTCPTEYTHRATSYTGGSFDPVKWGITAVMPSENCVFRASGTTLTLDYSTASTRSVGLELANLPFGSSVNVSSQAGYSAGAKFRFKTNGDWRRLCGRNGQPAASPGFIMGK